MRLEPFKRQPNTRTLSAVTVFAGSVSPHKTENSSINNTALVQVIDAKRERDLGSSDMKDVFQELN
ncbi:MAG: hypothetical protein F4X44_09630 [Gammaproteobacteria bacterium]|nr:hypothetical protein [Gammaproteobacteria bacterium]